MNFELVENYLKDHQYPSFRYQQLLKSIQNVKAGWDQVVGWPSSLQQELAATAPFVSWKDNAVFTSQDGTKKALLTLLDGYQIETVLMQPKPNHWSICISCEVGCPMNCAFCATGKMGLKRPLTAEEICDQIFFWQLYIQQTKAPIELKSIVFMGMGEPFHNSSAVNQAIDTLHGVYGFGHRHISVSTCGIPDEIISFANNFPQLNLAISLHAATDEVRQSLMPIALRHSLSQLQTVLLDYLHITKRQVMFEYLLISNINDRPQDQAALLTYLESFPKHLIHVNLIRYNQTYRGFEPTPISRVRHWKQWLLAHGISASIRKNLGTDIQGACGQLATKN